MLAQALKDVHKSLKQNKQPHIWVSLLVDNGKLQLKTSHSFEDHSSSPFVIFRGDQEDTIEKVAKELKHNF